MEAESSWGEEGGVDRTNVKKGSSLESARGMANP
jgi:hypothetical protein